MYEVRILNKKNNNEFTKTFKSKSKLVSFVKKVSYSKNLTLLSITDNSYLFD